MNITSLTEYRLLIETEINQISEILKERNIKNKNAARQIQEAFKPDDLKTADGMYIPYLFLYLDLEEIDQEALNAGADEKGLLRTASYVIYATREHNSNGHTRIRISELIENTKRAEKRLSGRQSLTDEEIQTAIFFITKKRIAVIEDDYFQLRTLYNAELNITNDIKQIITYSIEDKITEDDLITDIDLDDSQKNACLCINYPVSIITGCPGTGKSTILKTICDTWQRRNPGEIILAAPTGKAAQRMREATGREAQTIHRTLEIEPYSNNPKTVIPENCLLVLDECSMIDTYLFSTITEQATRAKNIILIGDKDQLQSVGPGAVFRDLIESELIPVFQLNTVHRQNKDSLIYKNSQNVLNAKKAIGFFESDDYSFDMEFRTEDCLAVIRDLYITEALKNQDVRIFVPIRDEKYKEGTSQINLMMHYVFKTEEEREYISTRRVAEDGTIYATRCYSEGDLVIWTKNDYDLDFLNGDTGIVLEASEDTLTVIINDTIVNLDDRKQISECLDLAYATTVHKAQGSSCDVSIVYLPAVSENYVEKSLLYVAMTRAKKRCHLIAEAESVQKAIFKTTNRDTGLREKLKTIQHEERREAR